MPLPIDTQAQFAKLMPRWLESDFDKLEQLGLVRGAIQQMQTLSARGHWTYDLNRHQALIELRDALEREVEGMEVAA